MLCAIISCSFLLRKYQRELTLSPREKLVLGMAAFVGAMIGAKLPFVIVDRENWLTGISWLSDGKTIMFGIVGGYFAVVFAKWLLGIRQKTGDSFALPVAIGVAIGRLACFSVGCCYGTPTLLPWGIHFSAIDSDPAVFRHPTQIYEALFHFTCALFLFFAWRKLYRSNHNGGKFVYWCHGNLLKIYLIAYLAFRFLTEFIRPEPTLWGQLSVYQIAAALILPIFVFLWLNEIRIRYQLLQNSLALKSDNHSDDK